MHLSEKPTFQRDGWVKTSRKMLDTLYRILVVEDEQFFLSEKVHKQ